MTFRLATAFLGITVLANGIGAQSPERPSMPVPCRPSNATRDANNLWQQMFWAEEAGARLDDDLRNFLMRGLHSDDTAAQVFAARALGRLEQPALISALAAMLSDKPPEVRSEAANAVGQAVQSAAASDRTRATGEAVRLLRARYEVEGNASVRGVICETLGRLNFTDPAEVRTIENLLVDATRSSRGEGSLAERLGAVKGLESLMRQNVKLFTPADSTIARLRELSVARSEGAGRTAAGNDDPGRVRRLSLLALAPHTAADEITLSSALLDSQWEARRLAVRLAAASLRAPAGPGKDARLAVIVSGMDVVDSILEGEEIRDIRIIEHRNH
jgi:hypothetical protein